MTPLKRISLVIGMMVLLLAGCSEDSAAPEGDDPLAVGDVVEIPLGFHLEIEDVAKSARDVTGIDLQVMIQARIVEVHEDFLDIAVLPGHLTDIDVAGNAGSVAIYDNPLYTSWLCISRREADGSLIGDTSGAVSMTIQIADSQTVMLGGLISLTDDPSDRDRLVPLLGDIPVLGMLFNSTNHEIRTTELIITLTPRIIDEL